MLYTRPFSHRQSAGHQFPGAGSTEKSRPDSGRRYPDSLKLLNHYQIIKPLTPYHQHNEHKVLRHLVDQLLQGKMMALLTDAGTPGISDPAFLLVRECIQVNIRVECLPGQPLLFRPW